MPSIDPATLTAAQTLAVDRSAAAVAALLRAEGIEPILLKGPSLVDWLYAEGVPRGYVDVDLLVDPRRFDAAETVLARNGYRRLDEGWDDAYAPHARAWRAADGTGPSIDLHRFLPGLRGTAPTKAWALLRDHRETMAVGGAQLDVLDRPARLLLIALHYAHHRFGGAGPLEKPTEDLRRALTIAAEEDWRSALALADRLGESARFARALRCEPGGDELADRIGAPARGVLAELRNGDASLALGIGRLANARSWRERFVLLRHELLPSPEYVRFSDRAARRGGAGALAWAYVRRLWRMARLAGPSYRAWRRADR